MREDDLLAAIRAAPDDDAPRLVYADWLMEQGGARAARGEWIQLCVRFDAAPLEDTPALTQRRDALFMTLINELFAPLAGLSGVDPAAFGCERGFLQYGRLPFRTFVQHGAELFRRLPLLSRLALDPLPHHVAREVSALAAVVGLQRLRALTIIGGGPTQRLGEAGFATLCASPHWPRRLRWLILRSCGVGDHGAALVAARPEHGELTALDLQHNGLTASGVHALAASPHLARLEELWLDGNELPSAAARALAGSPHLRALQTLSVHGVRLDPDAKACLQQRFGPFLHGAR